MKKPFPVKLLLEPEELRRVRHWYDKNKKNPVFKHLLITAYRDWTAVVHINNKIVTETRPKGSELQPEMAKTTCLGQAYWQQTTCLSQA